MGGKTDGISVLAYEFEFSQKRSFFVKSFACAHGEIKGNAFGEIVCQSKM